MITGASSGIGKSAALKVGEAAGTVLLVARTPEKLEETRDEIEEAGGTAHIHRCDLSDLEDIERMADEVLAEHGRVDILVNNAGRSIRRSVALSYDRFHDYERTMQLNYFGALKLIMKLLPGMRERKFGHIINISSIGVQTNTPRFSAYVASKAALDAFSRCIGSEVIDDGVHITTIHMPLVRTPMIAPTKMYDAFPTISPDEAAEMISRRDHPPAEEGRDEARHIRRGALLAGPQGVGRDPQPGLQAVPGLKGREGGKGQGRQGRGGLDRGRGVRLPDARRALVTPPPGPARRPPGAGGPGTPRSGPPGSSPGSVDGGGGHGYGCVLHGRPRQALVYQGEARSPRRGMGRRGSGRGAEGPGRGRERPRDSLALELSG